MRVFNSLTRRIEEFEPIDPPHVGMYSCGPTVYWNQHIGHMYAYVQWDCLVRFLRYTGNKVTWVMNMTDVGHLTSDEDEGEDKMEKGAKREGLSVWEIADKYIRQFLESMDLLNITRPDVLCRATDHIAEQIDLIKEIEANGFTYRTSTGLVFDTSKFPDYAKFAKLDLKAQEAGKRVDVDKEKRQPWDFLLWITNQPGHIMKWDSPWGVGFPGWHIECTAMSTKYLGKKFDIHTGGIEHIPVHHTNEIAQAFGAFGERTANYWLHNSWLLGDGEKMSKSIGNNILTTDLAAKGFDPLALRYLILNSTYHQGLNFTWEAMQNAQNSLVKLKAKIGALRQGLQGPALQRAVGCAGYEQEFLGKINADLNMPEALAVVWKMIDDATLPPSARLVSLFRFDQVLGLGLDRVEGEGRELVDWERDEKLRGLVEERERLRKEKEFAEADEVREKIAQMGYTVEDTPDGVKVKRA